MIRVESRSFFGCYGLAHADLSGLALAGTCPQFLLGPLYPEFVLVLGGPVGTVATLLAFQGVHLFRGTLPSIGCVVTRTPGVAKPLVRRSYNDV